MRPRVPSYCEHKPSRRAYVRLCGQQVYLGAYGSPESKAEFHRIVAEWHANGGRLPVRPDEITISELCSMYWEHASVRYTVDGCPTTTLDHVKSALGAMRKLYGKTLASEFGPAKLRVVRKTWIDAGLCRTTVNSYTKWLKATFKWAVSEEKISDGRYARLATVRGLERGRNEAKESEPVRPVPADDIDAIRSFVSGQVWAMIQLQLLTGARSQEVVGLRAIDIDVSEEVWNARLSKHKTAYRGKRRTLYFGPKAQSVLREFMRDRRVDAHLFSPREATAERAAQAPTHRRNAQPQSPRQGSRRIGEQYTVASYRRAVERGCCRAGVARWTPHRLRHNAATNIRKEFGLEAAQVILGHSHANITELYAELDEGKAIQAMLSMG